MTKKFCDLCETEAIQDNPDMLCSLPYGQPYETYIPIGQKQAYITISARFGFSQHKSGYGGPPDLCKECRVKLLTHLLEKSK
jgi:hypothetical protein